MTPQWTDAGLARLLNDVKENGVDNYRELLELAAKGADYRIARIADDGAALLLVGLQEPWNPLTDDGDAFRLAVKLDMAFKSTDGKCTAIVAASHVVVTVPHEGDASAAARCAIVRAAAEIGRTKP